MNSVSTFFALLLLSLFAGKSAGKQCQVCGSTVVPYPMSTAPDCGDPNYSIFCNSSSGQLYFSSINGIRYPISKINPAAQKLVVRLPPVSSTSCYATDYAQGGIKLNSSGTFNLSGDNTIMYFNCAPRLLTTPLDCSNTSQCWSYVRQVPEFQSCRSMNICCTFRAGGSATAAGVRLSNVSQCTAYQSFVSLSLPSPGQQWPQGGMELQWSLPRELQCRNQSECDGAIPNSNCSADPLAAASGIRRCFCNSGFRWDPITGTCINLKEECYRSGICRIRRIRLITGLTVSGFVLLISTLTGLLLYKRHLKAKEAKESLARKRQELLSNSTDGRCARLFSGKEINKATNSCSEENFLGAGGFGEVYKGTLEDGTVIAVKTAKIGNIKSTEQVLNEVRILSQVNHRHLLRLIGCCVELKQPMMVYEFASNGNLYDHLHDGKYDFLNWKQRLTIAHQTAEALAYLHFSAYPPIYHRDIKSSNILLDEKLNAKVSDFGISRLVDTELSHISTCAQGTLGYMDPEYYRNFQLTDKSDVYSFGVLLLELLTSEKVVDFDRGLEEANLVVYVQKRANEGKLMEMVDKELKAGASDQILETMRNFGFLAMGCLEDRRQDRPTMREVTEELGYIIGLYEVINAAATVQVDDSP
ncbi:Wall-associated receptor kinase-like 20 [Nymphaea thermarum]|nr:Wall-associated receptor kinase-like 20 [Nymphaea thermarum]